MAGFVYVLSNPAFPHLIKIGKSQRDPVNFRSAELYTTGVPYQFVVEYYAFVENFDFVEAECHKLLEKFRPNKSREFFEYPVPEAISLIHRVSAGIKFEKIFYLTQAEIKLAEERHQIEIKELAIRKDKERREREAEQELRIESRKLVDAERQRYIENQLSSNFIPSSLSLIFGVLTLILLIGGFGDGVVWPFLVVGLMWAFYWYDNKQRQEKKEQKAREKFPYN